MDDIERAARAALLRSAVIYGIILAVDALIVVYILSIGVTGAAWVWMALAAALGLLLAHYIWQHFADLKAPIATSEGRINRRWKHAELLIAWQSYYIRVDRRIFRLTPIDYALHDENMWVKVAHFPRTLSVVSVERIAAPADAEGAPAESTR